MNVKGPGGRDVEEAFLASERHWLDLVLPEEEWDATEVALLVDAIVDRASDA